LGVAKAAKTASTNTMNNIPQKAFNDTKFMKYLFKTKSLVDD